MKFNIVLGCFLMPTKVDSEIEKHDYALMIESELRNKKIILGMKRNEKLSRSYTPYWHRVAELEKLIEFRDGLTKLIEESK